MAAQLVTDAHPEIARDTQDATVLLIRRIIPSLAFHAQLELRTMMRNLLPSGHARPSSPHTRLP